MLRAGWGRGEVLIRCLSTPYTHRGTVGVVVSTETTITTHTTTAREGTIRDSDVVCSRTSDPLKLTPWGFAMLGCSLVTISLVTLNFGACWGGFQSVLPPLVRKTTKTYVRVNALVFNAAVGDDAGPADPQTHIFLETGHHELCAPNWVLSENQFCLNWGV